MKCNFCGKWTQYFHMIDGKTICPDCKLPPSMFQTKQIIWTETDKIIAHGLGVLLEAA